ncbi:MAG: hypothetical protein ACRDTA_01390 [Pseudonocardiaceae bacterium]
MTAAPVTCGEVLPVGTRVRKHNDIHLVRPGTVAHHEPQYSQGRFPVRWDDGIWETADCSDVVMLPGGDR